MVRIASLTMAGYAHVTAWLLVLGVFAVSASAKLRSREAFAAFVGSVRAMKLVPARRARATAVAVALAEAAVVVLLLVPPLAPAGFALAIGLLVVFVGATVIMLRRGTVAPCRCFGRSSETYGPAHLVRNGILLLVASAGLLGSPPASYDVGAVAVSAFTALCGMLLVVFLVDLVSLFGSSARHPQPSSQQRRPE